MELAESYDSLLIFNLAVEVLQSHKLVRILVDELDHNMQNIRASRVAHTQSATVAGLSCRRLSALLLLAPLD